MKIQEINNLKIDIKFYPKEEGISKFLNSIKKFGKILKSDELELYIKNDDIAEEKSSYFINTSTHKHPLEIIRRYINNWNCDICRFRSDQNNPSYHCTLCDFDLCIKCAKKFIKEGNVKQIN